MCLSKVYEKSPSGEKLLLSNVQRIAFDGEKLVFTDLFENETRICGRLVLADLVNGRVVVDTGA